MEKLTTFKLLPEKDKSYENTPWTWVLFLVLIELGIGAIAVIIVTILGLKSQSWIGIVAAMSGSMSFAMSAEKRQPGVLTKKIKEQLSLRAAIVMTIIGIAYFKVMQFIDPDGLQLPWPWLLGIIIVAFIFNWLAHRYGLNQGQKNATQYKSPSH